jgi:hypothetical protein
MVLRMNGDRTNAPVLKVKGKRMCIPSACLNVGSQKVQKATQSITRNGPYTYLTIQQILVAKKCMQYLKRCTFADILAAPPGSGFLFHADTHCAGLFTSADGVLLLSDPSYPNKVKFTLEQFQATVSAFLGEHPSTTVAYFHLAPGSYTPEAGATVLFARFRCCFVAFRFLLLL